MAPATAKALTFGSETKARNADEDFCEFFPRELFAIQRFGARRRLQDSQRAAAKLGAIANPAGDDCARRRLDAREKYRAAARERAAQNKIG